MNSKQRKVQKFVEENLEKVDGKTIKEIQQEYIEDNEQVSRATVSNALRHDDSLLTNCIGSCRNGVRNVRRY